METVVTIDLKHRNRNPRYVARLIWQELFSIYRIGGGDLMSLDSLLCDLDILAKVVQRIQVGALMTMYWGWGASGFTSLQAFPLSPDAWVISWPNPDQITITQKTVVNFRGG